MPVSLVFQALLQFAGVTMIALALAHFGLSKLLAWQEDTQKLRPINRQVFIVHTVFLAVGIFLLGLVCLFFAPSFLEKTTLAAVATACFAMCWLSRLICQIFVFRSEITKNKRLNDFLQVAGMMLWTFYMALFTGLCLYQIGVIAN
jgi:hypothetical protein